MRHAAENVTLLAFPAERYAAASPLLLSAAVAYINRFGCRAHNTKPAAAARSSRRMGQTDGHRTVT